MELAFACENLGYPQEDILKRIDRTVSDYHIEDLMGRSVFALSGGEKQKNSLCFIKCIATGNYGP